MIRKNKSILFLILNSLFVLNGFSAGSTQSSVNCSNNFEEIDYLLDWGVKLLGDNDPVLKSREYLKQILLAAAPGTVSLYPTGHPNANKYNKIFENFLRYFAPGTDLISHFEPIRFTNSGTEANNALFEFAEAAYQQRTGKKADRANLIYFGQPYGGTFGRIAEIGGRYEVEAEVEKNFHIPTPHIKSFDLSESELNEVKEIEASALTFIRTQLAEDELQIGGIFIEPISAFGGIFSFRKEFLGKLRVLADELKVPIFADEILTGGGRTGKFLASNHFFPEFEPDLFTFGKGMVVSGVASVKREQLVNGWLVDRWKWAKWNFFGGSPVPTKYPNITLDNTSRVNPLALAQSVAVLKRIRQDDLIDNARVQGAYFVERLRSAAVMMGRDPAEINGFGLLIYGGLKIDDLSNLKVKGYKGRWTPPLSLTKEEIDRIVKAP